MASLTIRNFDNNLKSLLRMRAASNGRSMEAEVRNILQQVLRASTEQISLAERIHERFSGIAVDSLPVPPRQEQRTPPDFEV